jgi:hypothetical protein
MAVITSYPSNEVLRKSEFPNRSILDIASRCSFDRNIAYVDTGNHSRLTEYRLSEVAFTTAELKD